MRLRALCLVLFFLVFCPTDGFSQSTYPFNETGYESVMKLARNGNKPVLYMFYASWCPHCHVMRDQVFPDAEVKSILEKNFIVAAQETDAPGGKALMRKYNVNSFPTFIVIDASGKLLYGFSGELKKADLIKELNDAKDLKKQLPYLASEFNADKSNADKCLAYVLALRKARQDADDVASSYLDTKSDKELVSAANWKIIANAVNDINSREFQYVLKHQKEFAAVSSDKRVERKIENIAQEALKSLAEASDTTAYKKIRPQVKDMAMRRTDSVLYVYDKQIYENTKNWKAYRSATFDATEKFAWKNYQTLRNTAGIYLSEFKDSESLKKAIVWAERASELQPSKESYLQIAKLYEKTNDIPKAIAVATQAKEFCEKIGFGTKEVDEILNRLQSK
ncbi:MAG: thioredoxin family protein [Flavobacterium sp.]|uniref:thioredoxin family protein n=1 Tax=Flavobacterium sp. TaxID=239 RepID=UPI0012010E67|nr:thioredoxin family protein [Flavobacterium sp.]RZJ68302.1 MAG: thioredoxin family protein [Flavobacterium sp.]